VLALQLGGTATSSRWPTRVPRPSGRKRGRRSRRLKRVARTRRRKPPATERSLG
jgi:hypothetical protein